MTRALAGLWPVLLAMAVVSLAGCGQKGPLYLPADAPASHSEQPAGNDPDNEHDSADESSSMSVRPGADDADVTRVPPDDTPMPKRLFSPLGTP